MATYTLRNKEKIVKAFGLEYYETLIMCLDYYFAHNHNIEYFRNRGEKLFHISIGSPKMCLIQYQFYIIAKINTDYLLAYKGKLE